MSAQTTAGVTGAARQCHSDGMGMAIPGPVAGSGCHNDEAPASQVDDDFEDDEPEIGDDCGRWDNGRLARFCTRAGTEECDWECPYNG